MNILTEMADLYLTRPALNATPAHVAAWYRAKARMHQHLATRAPETERAAELAYASAAYDRANRLAVTV